MRTSLRLHASAAVQWIVIIALFGVAIAVCAKLATTNKVQEQELAALRAETKELQRLRDEMKEVEKLKAQVREVEQLKKEMIDLPRLRGEVTQLRQEKAQADQLRAEVARLRIEAQQSRQLQTENQALRGQAQQLTQAQQALQVNAAKFACINNLKQIDGAAQQWALENRKTANDVYSLQDPKLLAYLKGSVLPLCPQGGVYVPGRNLTAVPTCTIPGHNL